MFRRPSNCSCRRYYEIWNHWVLNVLTMSSFFLYLEKIISHIHQVHSRLSSHGLNIKDTKCCWDFPSFKFLGHIVGKGKISIPDSCVLQLKNYVWLLTITQLRSLLDVANFYGKFLVSLCMHDTWQIWQGWYLTNLTRRGCLKNLDWNDCNDVFCYIVSRISYNVSFLYCMILFLCTVMPPWVA